MTFKLEFDADNDAFADGYREVETCRILREIADRIEQYRPSGDIRDINGNRIGYYRLD